LQSSDKELDHGSKFSIMFMSEIATFSDCSNKYFKYSKGFKLFSFEVSIMLYMIALADDPFGVLENSQFFLPITKGLIALSLHYC